MRDKMERFVALPFSIGCVSHSSVAVGEKKAPAAGPPPPPIREGVHEGQSSVQMRVNISAGLHKLIKGLKSLSQLFVVYKDEGDDDEDVVEMEIGLPTDVQHVAHIGWDGFNNVGTMKSWPDVVRAAAAPEFLPLPSLSIRQFELAMSAQADGRLAAAAGGRA